MIYIFIYRVNGLVFVAALSSYNTVLYEDGQTNGLLEAVNVFNETINQQHYFDESTLILILNKDDIFRNKILKENIPLSVCFSKEGGWPYSNEYFHETIKMPFETSEDYIKYYREAVDFIIKIFESRNGVENRDIYTHITIATENSMVNKLFADVQATIVRTVLRKMNTVGVGPSQAFQINPNSNKRNSNKNTQLSLGGGTATGHHHENYNSTSTTGTLSANNNNNNNNHNNNHNNNNINDLNETEMASNYDELAKATRISGIANTILPKKMQKDQAAVTVLDRVHSTETSVIEDDISKTQEQ